MRMLNSVERGRERERERERERRVFFITKQENQEGFIFNQAPEFSSK